MNSVKPWQMPLSGTLISISKWKGKIKMEKMKLRISAPLLAVIACLVGYYNGYVAALLVAGYVLICEENLWLRKYCVKTLLLMLAFSVAATAIDLVPALLGLLYDFLHIFNVNVYLSVIENIFNFFGSTLALFRVLLFLGWAFVGLKQKEIKIAMVDKFVDKHLTSDTVDQAHEK